ncbi:MAG: YHS domain-containing (seleno)protein [Pseudomonadota bacterium]
MATLLTLLLVAALGALPARASEPAPPQTHNHANGLMIQGFDPVSYFDGFPTAGAPTFAHTYDGVIYHFATEANRARFIADPRRFVPAYGGFCAYGVRMGQKLDIEPTAYRIVDGRLHLFLDEGTRLVWMMAEHENKAVADSVWPLVRGAEPGGDGN